LRANRRIWSKPVGVEKPLLHRARKAPRPTRKKDSGLRLSDVLSVRKSTGEDLT